MSRSSATMLEEIIRQAGEDWLIDTCVPPDAAIPRLQQTLEQLQATAGARLGNLAPEFSEQALLQEYRRNPAGVRAFLQVLGGRRSPEMLLMAWRIIHQGMELKSIELTYRRQATFNATVVLESPDGTEDAPYRSNNIHDFALFRHIGILEIDTNPVFEGFYPLHI